MFKGELLVLGKVHLSQQRRCFSKSQPLTCSDAQYLHLLLPNNLQLLHWRPKIRAFHLNVTSKVVVDFSDVVFHAENGGTLGMVPLIIPILTLYSGIYWAYPLFRCVLVKDFLLADYFAPWKRDPTRPKTFTFSALLFDPKKVSCEKVPREYLDVDGFRIWSTFNDWSTKNNETVHDRFECWTHTIHHIDVASCLGQQKIESSKSSVWAFSSCISSLKCVFLLLEKNQNGVVESIQSTACNCQTPWIYRTNWATKKPSFPLNPGWLIGILMVY